MGTPLFSYMRSLLLGSDQERINLTPKNNNMVPVRWVHPSFVICGPLGPDRERSHLTPKNNYMVPVRWVHPFSYYIRSLRARSRKKPFNTQKTTWSQLDGYTPLLLYRVPIGFRV
jgi:hypothetical protein